MLFLVLPNSFSFLSLLSLIFFNFIQLLLFRHCSQWFNLIPRQTSPSDPPSFQVLNILYKMEHGVTCQITQRTGYWRGFDLSTIQWQLVLNQEKLNTARARFTVCLQMPQALSSANVGKHNRTHSEPHSTEKGKYLRERLEALRS